MNEQVSITDFKRVNVFLTFLYSFFTLGTYIAYWFIRERKNLTHSSTKERRISIKLWWLFTVLLFLAFLHSLIGNIFFTEYGLAMIESFNTIVTFYFLALLYYSVFRIKEILEETHEEVIFKPWLLIFFHVWYVQYKINQQYKQQKSEINELKTV